MFKLILAATCMLFIAGCTQTESQSDEAQPHELAATGIPATAAVDQEFTFQLAISGPAASSDHIGAHFWNTTVTDPTAQFAEQAGACAHVAGGGEVPGTFDVSCTFTQAGEYTLYGHLRFTVDEVQNNFWSAPHSITVS